MRRRSAPLPLVLVPMVLPIVAALVACGSDASSPSIGADAAPDVSDASDGSLADARSDALEASTDASAADAADVSDASDAFDSSTVLEAAADTASCAPVTAAADVDPWSMRPKSAGFGAITTATSGGHTDVFLDSPGAYIRIGARLDWGGTIVFFGLLANPKSNVIDANDTGRELQVALYDPSRIRQPCAADASCATSTASCGNSITYLGWDPVQGGDECGHGATVLSHGRVGDSLELLVQPLQWNPNWDATDCRNDACGAAGRKVDVTYRVRLRFVREHVVEVDNEVASTESIDHPVTGQEWPTLYVANGAGGMPDLPLLLDAAGNAPAIATPANDGFFVGNFDSPAPWVTWQNSTRDYGVGLAMDQGITAFQGWRATSPYFHNVRAQIAFGIPHGGTVRGLSYLALGGFSTVKGELEAALAARGPFGHVDLAGPVTYVAGAPLVVGGWALDDRPGTTVEAWVDGQKRATATPAAKRDDVCAVYPAYPGCPQVGFSLSVPTAGLDACQHLLRVLARDADGNEQVLGERVIGPA